MESAHSIFPLAEANVNLLIFETGVETHLFTKT